MAHFRTRRSAPTGTGDLKEALTELLAADEIQNEVNGVVEVAQNSHDHLCDVILVGDGVPGYV